jgi:hypothetical protein
MPRQRSSNMINDASVQIRIPNEWLKRLKMKSYEQSLELGDEVRWTELVRTAIKNEFQFGEDGHGERSARK